MKRKMVLFKDVKFKASNTKRDSKNKKKNVEQGCAGPTIYKDDPRFALCKFFFLWKGPMDQDASLGKNAASTTTTTGARLHINWWKMERILKLWIMHMSTAERSCAPAAYSEKPWIEALNYRGHPAAMGVKSLRHLWRSLTWSPWNLIENINLI